MPLNFRFTDEDIRYCAEIGAPTLFLFDEEFAERIEGMKPGLSTVNSYVPLGFGTGGLESLMECAPSVALPVELKDEDECALYFTSGTTGAPMAVLHVHNCLTVSAITESTNHLWTRRDRNLMMSPLYHLAIGHLLGGLIAGA